MQYTTNFNLKKPEGTDVVNIDDLNYNADIIDTKLGSHNSEIADARGGFDTLRKKLDSYAVNVKDFGAKGDGVTDDTQAIQNALNASPPNSIIFVPDGTFLVTMPIIISKINQIVTGPGKIQLGADAIYALSVQADYVTIDNVQIINPNGYKNNATGRSGGIQVKSNNVIIRNCRIDGCVQGILVETNCKAAQIIGNTITNTLGVSIESGGDGIAVFGPNSVIYGNYVSCKNNTDGRCGIVLDLAGNDSVISGNTIEGPFRRSIHVELSPNSTILGNTMRGATVWGIIVSNNNISIVDNTIETPSTSPGPMPGQPQAGIYTYHATNITINGNIIYSGGVGNGIFTTGNQITIADNQIIGNTSSLSTGIYTAANQTAITGNKIASGVCSIYGIEVYTPNDCTINSNIIEKTGSYGIFIFGASNCIINGNLVRNCADAGIFLSGGQNHVVTENRCYDNQKTKTQTYGIYNWKSNNVRIADNIVYGNRNGGIAPNAGGTTGVFASGNFGYNPVGLLSAPAVPASGTPQTNTFPVRVRVIVSGGSVSAISINGTITGLTSGAFELDPGETITLTYTAAPTWVWMGL